MTPDSHMQQRKGSADAEVRDRAVIDQPAELHSRLIALIRSSSRLMYALRAARAVDPPDWLIGGGVIRDLVWDHLHDPPRQSAWQDLDLVFFDPASLREERELTLRDELACPSI